MAVKFRDYYETLGVSKTATDDDLRKAFRKLARQYHPDVAKGNKARAEEKFKEINEAYEVLSDPAKRKKYDQLGADWEQYERAGAAPQPGRGGFPGAGGAFRPGRGQPGGVEFDFGGSTGFSDFFEQFFGGGAAAGRGFGVPPAQGIQRGADVEADLLVKLEEALHGSQRAVSFRRTDPRTGAVGKTETYEIKIPPGVHEGQLIRLRGRGEPGSGAGAEPGDLFLRVRLAKHPDFRVEENGDLYYDLTLWPWQAVLGTEVSVPTLEGNPGQLKVPAGSQPGQKFRLRGKGLPTDGSQRGDLYVQMQVQIPKKLTAKHRDLWEQLAAASG